MDRVETTLFLLSSVDGKISTGDTDERDMDRDFPNIVGVKEGLHQFYELEKKTDFWSFNTGRVMAKIGMNEKEGDIEKMEMLRFVIVDNSPHLTERGVSYLSKKVGKLFIVTTNRKHPAIGMKYFKNLEIIRYNDEIDFKNLFKRLKKEYGAEKMTIQSGGTLNALLLRNGLIDHISIVTAPVLVGGAKTPTQIDGESLRLESNLNKIKALKLTKCEMLKDSYIHTTYDVIQTE